MDFFFKVSSLTKFYDVFDIMSSYSVLDGFILVHALCTALMVVVGCCVVHSKPYRESVNPFNSQRSMLSHDPKNAYEKCLYMNQKKNEKQKKTRCVDVIGKGSIGCIVIINIIMKFNGRLFTYESFTLDTNTHCTHTHTHSHSQHTSSDVMYV